MSVSTMAFKETARNAVDQVRGFSDNLLEKANKFKKATALAVLMAVGGAAASDAEGQETYTDTVPQGIVSTNEVYVQEDLLNVLEMTPQEFKEQVVKKDLANQDEILYFSGVTNHIEQKVNTLLRDTVYVIPNEELPPSGTSTGLISQALNDPNDGYYDQFNACANTNFRIVYGNFSNKGTNTGNIVVLKGNISENAREKILSHELGHGVGGNHPGDGSTESQPGEVQVVTERFDQYAEKKGLEDATLLLGYPTIMATTTNVGIYGHPQLNPDLEANVAKLMQQDIINSPQPLRVEINASADTINLDNALTLHAVPNRKQGEMGEYLFDWTIRQDGQVVFQGPGEEINYSPSDTGILEVQLTARKDCENGQSATSEIRHINIVEGATAVDNTYLNAIKLGPNPTNGMVELIGDTHTLDAVRIYTQEGLPLVELDGTTQQIDFSRWPAGMYHLQLIGQDGAVANKKVVKVQ